MNLDARPASLRLAYPEPMAVRFIYHLEHFRYGESVHQTRQPW